MGKNNSRASVSSLFAILLKDKLFNLALFVTVVKPILPAISLFKHTHLSLQQALTAEFAFLCRGELQGIQITQRCIYGICIIHEMKITHYLDERQLDNYS